MIALRFPARRRQGWYALLPRTRSSHRIAASAIANFGFKAAIES
jgi:hypothetical protein